MPHCIIEYANDLTELITPEEMMSAAFKAMQASELFEFEDIKIRSKDYAYFQSGINQKPSHKSSQKPNRANFIHVTVKILSGRNPQQKKNLASLMLNALDELNVPAVEITVDVQEMDNDSYMKKKNAIL